ncbi:isochorismatase family cysteine hydrolase [Pusillimonas noertemannii]|uniref:Nicotinamidase-related amidase n=1 Tax=Pusillimonas noertemannii TaxID=305977 RepID=A0A2U1CQW8_9BURK|nr:isochorismatase family cysteine hydrolase [Pusillimonas noertemannii]NYT67597.1 cysteine hydrolase [Pusillimonas noertemannii]PVY68269.1 nicotinamidase-related amidase [Pusillimonas noertemannii]
MNTNEIFQNVELVSKKTAVVVVDMENEFVHPEGKYYFGEAVPSVIQNTAALLERCREYHVPIIYVRSVRYPEDPLFTRFGREYYLLEGTSGPIIIDELRPLEGDTIIEKHTHDCFHKTSMDEQLGRMGILPETHHIIVVGVASNVCVYHAVLGFHVRHYFTVVPIDCMVGTPGGNDIVISQLSSAAYHYNVTLTTSDLITLQGARMSAMS